MATTTISGTTVVFSNSGAAADLTNSSLTEDSSSLVLTFDVLAASGGGKNTTLYSVDNGTAGDNNPIVTTNKAFADYDTDLLYSDVAVTSWQLGGDKSANGAHVWIGTDNKVHYDASNLAATLNALGTGQFFTDTFEYTIRMSNGTLSVGTITVKILGTNDGPIMTAAAQTGVITEIAGQTGSTTPDTASGAIAFSDADLTDTHSVSQSGPTFVWSGGALTAGQISALASASTLTLIKTDSTGTGSGSVAWSYAAQDKTFDFLAAGQTLTASYQVTINDGHGGAASQTVTVTINGTNDAAVISGTSAGSVVEAGGVANAIPGTPTATGTLTDTDVDNTPNTFQAVAAGTGSTGGYGTYAMTAGGMWTYTLNNNNVTVQALNAGGHLTDTFTVLTQDGTAKIVTIDITGTNDAAILSSATANLTETNAVLSTGGTLTITDVDNPATFVAQAGTVGLYGTFAIDTAGAWTYTASSAHDEFADGTTYTDTFSVASADGTLTSVTINILGTNDAAVLSADTRNLTETNQASDISASGTLTITDVDSPATFVAQAGTVGSYGTFVGSPGTELEFAL